MVWNPVNDFMKGYAFMDGAQRNKVLRQREDEAYEAEQLEKEFSGLARFEQAYAEALDQNDPKAVAALDQIIKQSPRIGALAALDETEASKGFRRQITGARRGPDGIVLTVAHIGPDGEVVSEGAETVNGSSKDDDQVIQRQGQELRMGFSELRQLAAAKSPAYAQYLEKKRSGLRQANLFDTGAGAGEEVPVEAAQGQEQQPTGGQGLQTAAQPYRADPNRAPSAEITPVADLGATPELTPAQVEAQNAGQRVTPGVVYGDRDGDGYSPGELGADIHTGGKQALRGLGNVANDLWEGYKRNVAQPAQEFIDGVTSGTPGAPARQARGMPEAQQPAQPAQQPQQTPEERVVQAIQQMPPQAKQALEQNVSEWQKVSNQARATKDKAQRLTLEQRAEELMAARDQILAQNGIDHNLLKKSPVDAAQTAGEVATGPREIDIPAPKPELATAPSKREQTQLNAQSNLVAKQQPKNKAMVDALREMVKHGDITAKDALTLLKDMRGGKVHKVLSHEGVHIAVDDEFNTLGVVASPNAGSKAAGKTREAQSAAWQRLIDNAPKYFDDKKDVALYVERAGNAATRLGIDLTSSQAEPMMLRMYKDAELYRNGTGWFGFGKMSREAIADGTPFILARTLGLEPTDKDAYGKLEAQVLKPIEAAIKQSGAAISQKDVVQGLAVAGGMGVDVPWAMREIAALARAKPQQLAKLSPAQLSQALQIAYNNR